MSAAGDPAVWCDGGRVSLSGTHHRSRGGFLGQGGRQGGRADLRSCCGSYLGRLLTVGMYVRRNGQHLGFASAMGVISWGTALREHVSACQQPSMRRPRRHPTERCLVFSRDSAQPCRPVDPRDGSSTVAGLATG